MTKKLTASEACRKCPMIGKRYDQYGADQQAEFDWWFNWVHDRIVTETAAEKTAEIERLRAELAAARQATPAPCGPGRTNGEIWDGLARKEHMSSWRMRPAASQADLTAFAEAIRDDERFRIAAVIGGPTIETVRAALRAYDEGRAVPAEQAIRGLTEEAAAKPATKPAPLLTGGQKARKSLEQYTGHDLSGISDDTFAAFAKVWGIPDDPAPPTDGELLSRAMGEPHDPETLCDTVAARFLQLRAERDGGEA